MMTNLYKIRRKSDGLFLATATYDGLHFVAKRGRVFKRKADLMLHLFHNEKYYKNNAADMEIVELETVIVDTHNVIDILQEKEEKNRTKEENRKKADNAYMRELRRQEYLKLHKEFGS